jgi:two-component system, chemotaxis family, protein-glutamate methylesterase/glutaminase
VPGRDIVVIGASAGGVRALRKIIRALPANINAAILVCVHVAPDRPSLLPKILGKSGVLPARHPKDKEKIRRGCIYVAPPDNHLLVEGDLLRILRGPQENRFRPAIDALFRSAARAHGPRVIGVVLTGNLDDGTVGLQAIKHCGGVTIVQDPKEAEYTSMPTSAMRFATIDHSVPLADLPALLMRLVEEAPGEAPSDVPAYVEGESNIAAQKMNTQEFLDNVEKIGSRTTYACPLCNGSIWQIGNDEPLRFRCHVGHSFTAEFFWAEQSQNLENALWSAIRIMEEKVTFARQFARRLRDNKLDQVADKYESSASAIDEELTVIRDVIVSGRATTRNVFEEQNPDVRKPVDEA